MNLELLNFINPWWIKDDWEDKDKQLKDWNSQKIRWIPKWIDRLSLEPFSLNFVLGPRQVGKTTGIKLLIKRLIDQGLEPERIMYLNCDSVPDFTSLRRIIENYISNFKVNKPFIFLDEVTTVDKWWKAVKFLIDSGVLSDSVVIVTGSSSLKIKKDMELFPGRMGKGSIVEVLPLNFKDYIEIHGIKNHKLAYDKVLELFEKYKKTGGFPLTINDGCPVDILNSILAEIVRFGKSLELAKETLSSLISKIPSAMSFRAIASETSGYSYKTIQEYLEFFGDLYVIGFAYLKQNNKILYRRERKIFFRDPLLLDLFSKWTNTKFLESALYENIVQEHLYRKYGEIYYYRNKYEIDCISGPLKVEVKAGKPHRKYPKDVIVLGEEDIPRFLIEMFGESSSSIF